jgi:raffinose/stachyose/melibiose transport system permease protein
VLILVSFVRDVPRGLFESVRLVGASEWRLLWRNAFQTFSGS